MPFRNSRVRSFATDARGAVGVFFAVGFVGILGIAAIAADHAMWLDQRSDMQSIADAAALAGARDFAANGSVKSAERIAAAYLKSKSIPTANYKITVDEDRNLVETSVSMPGKQYLSSVIKSAQVNLSVVAQAQASESARPCIIALEPGAAKGIDFSLAGSVAAYDCAIWSNATSATSFDLNGSGTAFSSQNCAVGGISGNSFAITPPPQAKCSPAIDPLLSWSPPSVFTCDFFSQERFNSGSIVLNPGVYCGGIKIAGSSTVTLSPGVYVIKDGPLSVTSSASLIGDGVTLIFMGNGASASFLGSSKVRLSAAT
jgi:Flp pilus assembly protein TadG